MGWGVLLVRLFKKMRQKFHASIMRYIRSAVIGKALEPHLGDNWKPMHEILMYHGSMFSLTTMD